MNNLARQPQKMLRPPKEPRRRKTPGIPTGWRKLHEIAVTLNADQVQAYGDTELGEFFGVIAQAESDSAQKARHIARSEPRPSRTLRLGNRPKKAMRYASTDRLHRLFAESERRRDRHKRRSALKTSDNDHCEADNSGTGPPQCNHTNAHIAGGSLRSDRRVDNIRLTRGSPPEHEGGSTHGVLANREKTGRCAREVVDCSESKTEPRHVNRETRILRPRILRPPKVSEERISDLASQPRCWTESALLYIQNGDTTQCVAVKLKKYASGHAGSGRTEMQMIRPKVPRRATKTVARRLNHGTKTLTTKRVTQGPEIRTARDGPPTVEVDS